MKKIRYDATLDLYMLHTLYNTNSAKNAQTYEQGTFGIRGFQKAQMDFSKRKCSGDGFENKKGLAIYLKTVAKLISNLSVFIVLGWRKRPAISADGQTNRQTGGLGLVSPIESVGFYLYT